MQTMQIVRLAAMVARSYIGARCARHWVPRTYHAKRGQCAALTLLKALEQAEVN